MDEQVTAIWPIWDICITTPTLELRPATPPDWFALAELAAQGIHDPAEMPFAVPWTDAAPPQLQRNSVQFYALGLASFSVDAWSVPFVVRRDGELVGTQDVMTREYPVLRNFETGSWVTRARQGEGIGKEMRAAVVHFMFERLGALDAFTSAWDDNPASRAVTRSLGYREHGGHARSRRGERVEMHAFRLSRDDWVQRRRDDIVVEGLNDGALAQFGLLPEA